MLKVHVPKKLSLNPSYTGNWSRGGELPLCSSIFEVVLTLLILEIGLGASFDVSTNMVKRQVLTLLILEIGLGAQSHFEQRANWYVVLTLLILEIGLGEEGFACN